MLKLVVKNEPKTANERELHEFLAYLQINALHTVWSEKLGYEHLITEGLALLLHEMSNRFIRKGVV